MGKIKKILENELVGGTQSTDVYPVTSTKAIYDENNVRLDTILKPATKESVGLMSPEDKNNIELVQKEVAGKVDKASIVQESGDSEELVMSQKAVSDKLKGLSTASNTYTSDSFYSERGKNKFFNRPRVGDTFSYENAITYTGVNIVEVPIKSGTILTDVHLKGIQSANSCIICGLDLKVKKVIPYPITQDLTFDEAGIAFFNIYIKDGDRFTVQGIEVLPAISEHLVSIAENLKILTQFNLSPNSLFEYKLFNRFFPEQKVGTTFSFETSTLPYEEKTLDIFIIPVIPGLTLTDVYLKELQSANSYIVVDRNMKVLKSVRYPITGDITFDVEGIAIFNMHYTSHFKITNTYQVIMALTKLIIDTNNEYIGKIKEIISTNAATISGFALFSKIIFIGDSLTEGNISDLTGATPQTVRKSLSYPAKVAQIYNTETVNLGHSGISVSGWLSEKYSEFTANKEGADCCVIELGWNYPGYPKTEEEIDEKIQTDVAQYGDDYNSYNTASSIGCYCKLIKKIQNDAPNIVIFLVASFGFPRISTYATKKIASQTGVIFLDASSYSQDGHDKIHFTAFGYAEKAVIISSLIGNLPDEQKRIISSKLRMLHAD